MLHDIIDRRAIAYARVMVWLIDHDPTRKGLLRAKKNLEQNPNEKWKHLMSLPWEQLRMKLVEKSDEMQHLRQMTPFFGPECLSESLRQRIFNKYMIRNGKKPIEFKSIIIPPPPPIRYKRKKYKRVFFS